MGNRHARANHGLGLLVRAVNNRPVLNIRIVSDSNGMNVTAHHCIEPNRAALPHHHISHHHGIIGYKTARTESGLKTSDFLYNRHTSIS
jgi:hypothetical protein